jgi:hypothetical protein
MAFQANNSRKIALDLGTALLALSASQGAFAQSAPASDPAEDAAPEIVVTGFRESLSSALSLKRRETAAIDAIKAEDIVEFPDLNLEMINLTDAKNDQFVDETNRLNVLTHSGRQFNFGAKFTF